MKHVVKLYLKGFSSNEIAKKTGLSRWKVGKILNETGVMRSQSEAVKLAYKKGLLKSPQWDRTGENNPFWRGGRVNHSGYVRVLSPDHPNKDKHGYVFEHRLVAEKMLGRYLLPTEAVHHINHVRDDNRPENLKVMDSRDHWKLHKTEIVKRAWEKSKTYKLIKEHGEDLKRMEQAGHSRYRMSKELGVPAWLVEHAFKKGLTL